MRYLSSTGSRTRGYSPSASRLSDDLSDELWVFLTKVLNWLYQNESINNKWLHAQCHPEFSSGSVRGEGQEKARCQMLKQVQHDIWRHLLFILSFWGSQFKIFVKNTHYSSLIAHCSKAQRRLEDAKPVRANSRGFLNPWNNWQDKEIASGRRGTATVFNVERWTNVVWKIHVAVPRLCRRPLLCVLKKPRAWKPPAIHVHVFQTFFVHNSSLKASEKCLIHGCNGLL